MAKPDIDDGWYKKSIELEAALDYAGFTKLARTILRFGFSQIFGVGRRPRFIKLKASDVIDLTGKPRQDVSRAFLELTLSRVLLLVEGQEDTYRFAKDYELWRRIDRQNGLPIASDEPRLTPREVRDCKFAVEYAMSFKLPKHEDRSGVTCDSHRKTRESLVTTNGVICDSNPSHNRLQSESQMTPNGGPPMYPLLGREIEIREGESKDARTDPIPAGGDEAKKQRGLRLAEADPDDEPFLPPPGSDFLIEPPDEIERIKADPMTAKLFAHMLQATTDGRCPGGRIDLAQHACYELEAWVKQGYPAHIVKDAINETIKARAHLTIKRFSSYAQAILNEFADRQRRLKSPPAPSGPTYEKVVVTDEDREILRKMREARRPKGARP